MRPRFQRDKEVTLIGYVDRGQMDYFKGTEELRVAERKAKRPIIEQQGS